MTGPQARIPPRAPHAIANVVAYFTAPPRFIPVERPRSRCGAHPCSGHSPYHTAAGDDSAVFRATIMISISSKSRGLRPQFPAVPPHMLTTDRPAMRNSSTSSVGTKPHSRTATAGNPSRGGRSDDSTSVSGSKRPFAEADGCVKPSRGGSNQVVLLCRSVTLHNRVDPGPLTQTITAGSKRGTSRWMISRHTR